STHPGAHASGFIHLHPSEQGDDDEDGIRPLLERLAARRPTPTHWSRTLDAQRDEQGRLALSLDLHGRRTIVLEGHGEEAVSATLEGVDMIGLGHSIVCARTAPDAEEPLAFGSFSTRTRWLPTLSSDGTIRVLPEAEHLEFEVQIVDAETQGLPTPPHRTRAQIEAEVLQHVTPLQPVYLEPIYAPDAHEDAPIDDPTTAPTARVSPFARATVRQMALIALQALQALVALIDEDEQAS
ncbi:MAG: hypothetical protein GY913_25600, partial [Proteobacteria bacterium]|nr:hypothetical protein [Pseudomonadota bacterium]